MSIMSVHKIPLPPESLIAKSFPVIDYADCFAAIIPGDKPVLIRDCIYPMFNDCPKWVDWLMRIRNILVYPFGLKGSRDNPGQNGLSHTIAKGNELGLFTVMECNDHEVLLGIFDSHLDACISVFIEKNPDNRSILLSTAVKFNNNLGKIYFFIIKPFHIIIVPALLKKLINTLKTNY
jgi:hypothetical protein